MQPSQCCFILQAGIYVGMDPLNTPISFWTPLGRILAYRSFELFLGTCKCVGIDSTPSLYLENPKMPWWYLKGHFIYMYIPGGSDRRRIQKNNNQLHKALLRHIDIFKKNFFVESIPHSMYVENYP